MTYNYTFSPPILQQEDYFYDDGTGNFLSVSQQIAAALAGGGAAYVGGTNISISGTTIALSAPASAALLATNSGGNLGAVVLGTNLSISNGNTLNASGSGTVTASAVSNVMGSVTVANQLSGGLALDVGERFNIYDPLEFGAHWNGNSYPISNSTTAGGLGISTWAALLAYNSGQYSFLSTPSFGLSFTDTTTQGSLASGSTVMTFGGPSTFTGVIASGTLTVSGLSQGGLAVGEVISVPSTTYTYQGQTIIQATTIVGTISALGTGTGGNGTYILTGAVTTSSTTMNGSVNPRFIPVPRAGQQVSGAGIPANTTIVAQCSFTATITAAGLMTVSGSVTGGVFVGQFLFHAGSAVGRVMGLGTGTGGTGTYYVQNPTAVSAVTVTGNSVGVLSDPSYTICLSAATTASIPYGETITFQVSDADTALFEMDWLACMFCANAVSTTAAAGNQNFTQIRLPEGTGRMGKQTWITPALTNMGQSTAGNYVGMSRIVGKGQTSTLLRWDGDPGAGNFLMRGPSWGVYQTGIKWQEFSIFIATSSTGITAYGSPPNFASGMLTMGSGRYRKIGANNVWSGAYVSSDHEVFELCDFTKNWMAVYQGYSASDGGNQMFFYCNLGSCYLASFGAAWNNGYANSQIMFGNCNNTPSWFYREMCTPGNCGSNNPWIVDLSIYDTTAEALGSSAFFGASAYNAFYAGSTFGVGWDSITGLEFIGNTGASTNENGYAGSGGATLPSPGLWIVSSIASFKATGPQIYLGSSVDFTNPLTSALFCITGNVNSNPGAPGKMELGDAGGGLLSSAISNTISASVTGTVLVLASGSLSVGQVLGTGAQRGSFVTGNSGGGTYTVSASQTSTVTSAGVPVFFCPTNNQLMIQNTVTWSIGGQAAVEGLFVNWNTFVTPSASSGNLVAYQGPGLAIGPSAGNVLMGVAYGPSLGANPFPIAKKGIVTANKDATAVGNFAPVYYSAGTLSAVSGTATGTPFAVSTSAAGTGATTVQIELSFGTVVL